MMMRLPAQVWIIARPAVRAPCICNRRGYATDNLASNASEVLRNAQRQKVRMPGPFPDGTSAAGGEREATFRELGFGRKILRSGRNLTNAGVVLFGICLTGGIVYAISTELLASAAPTRIFNAAVPHVQDNDELTTIFRQPWKFHGSGSDGTKRHRNIHSIMRRNSSGLEEQVVRFALSAHIKDDPNESYYSKFKRWLRPIVVEPSNQLTTSVEGPPQHKEEEQKGFWGALLHAFVPRRDTANHRPAIGFTRRKPVLGEYHKGEVVCVLIRVPDGSYQFKSIHVDIPSSDDAAWRTRIVDKSEAQVLADAKEAEANKLWNKAKAMISS